MPIYSIMGDVGDVTQLAECRIVYPVVAGSNPAVLAFVSAILASCSL